jgi:two-component system, OmpR family, KDP operon response regulator KdpE
LTAITISDELRLRVIIRRGGGVVADARILLVEDDDLNQMLVWTVLARSGDPMLRSARLVQAASLAEARAALASSAVDVVLLDMNLPDGNGLSLAAEVRRTGPGGPAVVALTGAGPEQGDAALAAGCTAVLGKPYQAAQLCAVVCAALSN